MGMEKCSESLDACASTKSQVIVNDGSFVLDLFNDGSHQIMRSLTETVNTACSVYLQFKS